MKIQHLQTISGSTSEQGVTDTESNTHSQRFHQCSNNVWSIITL